MFIGILFILVGILIVIYPQLLSLLVASILITIGISSLLISYHYKRLSRHFDNPFMEFFVRF